MTILSDKEILNMVTNSNLVNPETPYSEQNCTSCIHSCKDKGLYKGSFMKHWCPCWCLKKS